MATLFACSFNIFYIYQPFILLLHKALHPPSLFLSLSVHLSLFLWYLSRFPNECSFPPVWRCLCFLLAFQSYLQLDTYVIHYPVNPSSHHFHSDVVLPSSGHCRTETVLPPSDHYCIETVAPSCDNYCIDIVVPSSDHCCTETVPPSSDHYGTRKAAAMAPVSSLWLRHWNH